MKLQDLAKKTFKSTRRKSSTKNMAGKKGRKSKSRKSPSNSGVFSGKVLGFQIPLVSDVIRNKTVQKVLASTGAVTTLLTIASLINNPTVNKVANNELVQLGVAGATGDIVGVGAQLVRTRGLQRLRGGQQQSNGGNQMLISQAGNGVA